MTDQTMTKEKLACLEVSLLGFRAGQVAAWHKQCGTAAALITRVKAGKEKHLLKEKEEQAILGLWEKWSRQCPSEQASQVLRACEEKKIGWITLEEANYPYLLKQIADPPLVLYYRGDVKLLAAPCISIVGSRKASAYGQRVAYELGQEAVTAGFVVVSGLAKGIDSCAHKGALDQKGKTLTVMPCGLDLCYPKAHLWLYHRICEEGLAVSEYPPAVKAEKWHFIDRNRIISGLSGATVVAQAGPKSGSIRTAQLAAEQGREVFGVPGDIYDTEYLGVHYLIQDGANVMLNAKALMKLLVKAEPTFMLSEKKLGHAVQYAVKRKSCEIADQRTVKKELKQDDQMKKEAAGDALWLYEKIEGFGCLPEQLCQLTGREAAEVQQAITVLELKGLIQKGPGQEITKV